MAKVVIRETLKAPVITHVVKLSDHQNLESRVKQLEDDYAKLFDLMKQSGMKMDLTEITNVDDTADQSVHSDGHSLGRASTPEYTVSIDETILQNVAEMKHQEFDSLAELRREQEEEMKQAQEDMKYDTEPLTPTSVVEPESAVSEPSPTVELHPSPVVDPESTPITEAVVEPVVKSVVESTVKPTPVVEAIPDPLDMLEQKNKTDLKSNKKASKEESESSESESEAENESEEESGDESD